jgi:hypothetical protein
MLFLLLCVYALSELGLRETSFSKALLSKQARFCLKKVNYIFLKDTNGSTVIYEREITVKL